MTTATPAPVRDLLAEYRNGLVHKKLLMPRCTNCGELQFPPKTVCPACYAVNQWEMSEVSGRGTIWSYVVFHKKYLSDGPDTPYDVTVIELDEGPRVFGKIIGDGPTAIGASVTAVFDGPVLSFRSAQDSDSAATQRAA